MKYKLQATYEENMQFISYLFLFSNKIEVGSLLSHMCRQNMVSYPPSIMCMPLPANIVRALNVYGAHFCTSVLDNDMGVARGHMSFALAPPNKRNRCVSMYIQVKSNHLPFVIFTWASYFARKCRKTVAQTGPRLSLTLGPALSRTGPDCSQRYTDHATPYNANFYQSELCSVICGESSTSAVT